MLWFHTAFGKMSLSVGSGRVKSRMYTCPRARGSGGSRCAHLHAIAAVDMMCVVLHLYVEPHKICPTVAGRLDTTVSADFK